MDSDTLVSFALAHGNHARVAMRESSMLPLLHEPQVLEIAPLRGRLRVGQIAVFRDGARLVAHRVVRIRGDIIWCAGDARPHATERIDRASIVGVVDRVRAHAQPNASRVDGLIFSLRGDIYARTRVIRARWIDANPRLRPRTYAALIGTVAAMVRDDRAALAQAIRAVEPWRLAAVADRHRCGAMLASALDVYDDDDTITTLRARLQDARRRTAMRTAKLRAQLLDVLRVLRADGLDPVLLKGAARLWRREPGSDLHDSSDLDLLLSPHDVVRARAALLRAGYVDTTRDGAAVYYETTHHHAAPLYPPGHGVAVELHRALARADLISIPLTRDALEPLCEIAESDGERVRVLNRAGTALHLIVHGHARPALRDIYLIARLLRQMNDGEREMLRLTLAGEQRERIRIGALTGLAASLAGVPWPCDTATRRFMEWMIQREDLPRPLRVRPVCYDAWLATEHGRVRAVITTALRLYRTHPAIAADQRRPPLIAALRPFAALLAGVTIAAYVRFMRRSVVF